MQPVFIAAMLLSASIFEIFVRAALRGFPQLLKVRLFVDIDARRVAWALQFHNGDAGSAHTGSDAHSFKMQLTLNRDLNLAAFAERYEEDRFVQIPNIFDDRTAAHIETALQSL